MKKFGIALAGGGARGAYQVGVWKSLLEHGLDKYLSCYSGASVGSLNAALMAMNNYDLACKLWLDLDKTALFHLEEKITKRLRKERLNFFNRGIYDTKRLEKILVEYIDFDLVKEKDIFVTTTHLGDEKSTFFDLLRTNYKHYFHKDTQVRYENLRGKDDKFIVQALIASCAIPIVFRPVKINGETFYDGGVLDNTPYSPLVKENCDVILIVDLYKFSSLRVIKPTGAKFVTVYPKKNLGRILDFKKNRIYWRFEQGYKDMSIKIEELKALLKEE